MLLRRLFKRARTRSSDGSSKQICLCTTAKRDSFYDDSAASLTNDSERQLTGQYGSIQSDKSMRLMRQASLDDSDDEDDVRVIEKLRRASSRSPANIPMLVVVSFNPGVKGLQKKQIEIQRGFPVNAQYILNEWLFIKTADNEQGFVPYVCCRPMFRRQSTKCFDNTEYSYELHNFELNKSKQIKSPTIIIPTLTPGTAKKISLSANLSSPSYLVKKPTLYRRRPDAASSSCGGDSGVSDCESSTNNHHCSDLLSKHNTHLANIQSLCSSSNTLKKTGFIVQDLQLEKSIKPNQVKSPLVVSSNSAFTQIVKKPQKKESSSSRSFHSNNQSFHYVEDVLPLASKKNNLCGVYDRCDEKQRLSLQSSKYIPDNNNMFSSSHIRRTPYTRRSLQYHTQSTLREPLYRKPSSSPDPFSLSKKHRLENVALAKTPLSSFTVPFKSIIERHFSDLSLNQIENDSFSPSASVLLLHNEPSLSCSTSSSSSTTSSSTDDSITPFIPMQMNNYRTEQIPVVYTSSSITNNDNNSNIQSKRSTSFIHNVSITV